MNMRRSSRPSSVRTGIFCKFGSTEESRPVLEFLQMLCEIGAHYPGFETDIHGAYRQADGRYTVKVLKEENNK